uniref:Uncharacterized protein n=1 Tax=Aegilops tauschii subsp. strangulata TaxID=200361 RepID=A0A453JQZ8_AEGTS
PHATSSPRSPRKKRKPPRRPDLSVPLDFPPPLAGRPWRRRPSASAGPARRGREAPTAASSASSCPATSASPSPSASSRPPSRPPLKMVSTRRSRSSSSSASSTSTASSSAFPSTQGLESSGPPYCWNELITLCTKYRDLTSLAQLAFTVFGMCRLVRAKVLLVGPLYFCSTARNSLKQGSRSCSYGPKRRQTEEYLPQPLARFLRMSEGKLSGWRGSLTSTREGRYSMWIGWTVWPSVRSTKSRRRSVKGWRILSRA